MLTKDGTFVPEANTGGGEGKLDQETIEMLKGLGYMQDGDDGHGH